MKKFEAKFQVVKLELEDIITTSRLIDGGNNGDFGDGEIVIPQSASLLK